MFELASLFATLLGPWEMGDWDNEEAVRWKDRLAYGIWSLRWGTGREKETRRK